MAALAGIMNQQPAASSALSGKSVKPLTTPSTGTSSSSTSSSSAATISSNDFLTLLVTELKNQDPTSNADPNEYVNQLVSVNSLEQLVNINQTLTTDASSGTNATGTGTSGTSTSFSGVKAAATGATTQAASSSAASGSNVFGAAAAKLSPGNLGLPTANPNAQSVANALNGQHIPIPH